MQRPTAVALERRAQRCSASKVQRLEMVGKACRQHADLTGRDADTVLALQGCADLLALTMLDKALEADEDDHVVANHAARLDALRQGESAPGHSIAGGMVASARAHTHALPSLELSVLQGLAVTPHGLLHACRATTRSAGLRCFADVHQSARRVAHLLDATSLLATHVRPHRRERFERDSGVFFPV